MRLPRPEVSNRLRAARTRREGWRGPILVRTLDAAIAATVAWALVQPLDGVAEKYPYLAPLGAVITVTESVTSSVREGLATVANLAVGALLGTLVLHLQLPVALGLTAVIAVGAALEASGVGAGGAAWLSYGAVLVLVAGAADPLSFGLSYAGLVLLGAVTALLTMWLMPPLLLTPSSLVIAQAGEAIAAQLDDLGRSLDRTEPPTQEQWAARHYSLTPSWQRMADTVRRATQSRRGNWRARWWLQRGAEQDRVARIVEETFPLVQHLTLMLTHDERADRREPALGPSLRPVTVQVLRAWATLVRCATHGQDSSTAHRDLGGPLDELVVALRAARRGGADAFVAGTVVSTVRRGRDLAEPTSD